MYNLNNLKKEAINQLRSMCNLNDPQLGIIEKLISRCENETEVRDTKNLFLQKNKLFGAFDFAPDADDSALKEIALLQKDEAKSFALEGERERELLTNKGIENTFIIGDNFDTLRNLQITSSENIDVIYIDPPYNTGGTNLGYKDKFGKDAWLSLMYERLEYAHNLLKDDGIIFVSIDDNMQAYLKVIMDEIFGEENFLSCIFWQSSTGSNDTLFIKRTIEYVLCYFKNQSNASVKKLIKNIDNDQSYDNEDEYLETRGKYKLINLDNASHSYSKGLDYEFEYNGIFYYPGNNKEQWIKRQNGEHSSKDWTWMWSKNRLINGIKNGFVTFENNRIKIKRYQYVDLNDQQIIRTELFKDFVNVNEHSNSKGTSEQKLIFGLKVFDHPKPISIIKHLINLHPNKNAIVLDFFAGSGTTAEAVLELNKEDNGNRKYIVCTIEQDQDLNVADICYERIYRINHGYGTKHEELTDWLKKHTPYNTNLNVYKIIKKDISLEQDFSELKNYNFNCYKELNSNLEINSSNFMDELYGLSVRNWWLQ